MGVKLKDLKKSADTRLPSMGGGNEGLYAITVGHDGPLVDLDLFFAFVSF